MGFFSRLVVGGVFLAVVFSVFAQSNELIFKDRFNSLTGVFVTVETTGDGDATPLSQAVAVNTSAVIKLQPGLGYRLGSAGGCGGSVQNSLYIINQVTDDCIVMISFEPNQYTVSFDSNGGSAVNAITQDFGTAITAPTAPTREGYRFTGWSPPVPNTMPAEDVGLTAQWSISQYTLSFDSNGGSAVESITSQAGDRITKPAYPTRTGYTFAGWSPSIPEKMPTENLLVTAVWSITFFLAENGITITCDDARMGDTGFIGGRLYTKRNPSAENAESTCTSGIWSFSWLFRDNASFNSDISHWDTSSATRMIGMFNGATSFNQDISSWDVSSVEDFSHMFRGAENFNQALENWDTSSALEMESMFSNAKEFNQPLNQWNISSVTNLSGMFRGAEKFNQPLGNWDTSAAIYMDQMFMGATNFNQSLWSWNVENALYMKAMFNNAAKFNRDLSTWCPYWVRSMPGDFDTGATSWITPRPPRFVGKPCATGDITEQIAIKINSVSRGSLFPVGYNFCGRPVTFSYMGSDVTYGTLNGVDQTCWLDRNLGASRKSDDILPSDGEYGDLFQWGRPADGHQIKSSSVTYTVSENDPPTHSDFIAPVEPPWSNRAGQSIAPVDWLNNNQPRGWALATTDNDPCPEGFKVPSVADWENEVATWPQKNRAGAMEELSLPFTKVRYIAGGVSDPHGFPTMGLYWSTTSTRNSSGELRAESFAFREDEIFYVLDPPSKGHPIRCFSERAPAPEILLVPKSSQLNFEINPDDHHVLRSIGGCNGFINEDIQYQTVKLEDSCEIYVEFEPVAFPVNLDTNGGDEIQPLSIPFAEILTLPIPVREGYSFDGWSPPPPAFMPAQSLEFTAKWRKNSYLLILNTDGGRVARHQFELPYQADLPSLPVPSKSNFNFVGWSITPPQKMPSKNVTLVAQWARKAFEVDVTTTEGGVIRPTEGDFCGLDIEFEYAGQVPRYGTIPGKAGKCWLDRNLGAEIVATSRLLIDERSRGHLFQWGRGADGHQRLTSSHTSVLADDLSNLHSKWITGGTYNNSFDWYENNSDQTRWNGSPQLRGPCPAPFRIPSADEWESEINAWDGPNSNNAFANLRLGGTGSRQRVGDLNNEITLHSYWSSTAWKSSFHSGGVMIEGDSYDYVRKGKYASIGAAVRCVSDWQIFSGSLYTDESDGIIFTVNEQEGFTLNAISGCNGTLSDGSYYISAVSENCHVTADFEKNIYTIYFDSNGGDALEPIAIPFDDGLPQVVARREGFSFLGWKPQLPLKMPAQEIYTVAEWEVNQYTISFDSNGGLPIEEMTLNYGASIEIAAPTRTNYSFIGWDIEVPDRMPAKNLHLIAQWKKNW